MCGRMDGCVRWHSRDKTVATSTAFGVLLRRYRLAAGLTQEQLAERASVSTRAVSDLERGGGRMPRLGTVTLLSEALALTPQQQADLRVAASLC